LAQSLKQYLSNLPEVRSAQNKWVEAGGDLSRARKQWESTDTTDPLYRDILAAYRNAEAVYKEAEARKNSLETQGRTQYQAITSKERNKNKAIKDAEIKKDIDNAKAREKKYLDAGLPVPESIKTDITNLESQLGGPTGPTVPAGGTGGAGVTGDTGPAAQPNVPLDTFLKNLNGAGAAKINEVRIYLGLKPNGQVDYDLITKAQTIESRLAQEEGIKGPIDRLTYYALNGKSGGGAGGEGGPVVSISSPTEAAAYINSAFRSLLGRFATSAEIKELRPLLNAAEKKNPSRTVNGVSTGGLNRDQFLLDLVTKRPEYVQRKQSSQELTKQALSATAKANGLNLATNFTDQIDGWVKRVENGEDIDIFKNLIRQNAKVGLPDKVGRLLDDGIDLESVYAPYKNAMAAILEINPETINLNDRTLRSAIGPDKEMTIYDFEKNLRKDFRWQYTDNAKRDVSNVALKVLQDFGFQA
jgi:hypothetical protein